MQDINARLGIHSPACEGTQTSSHPQRDFDAAETIRSVSQMASSRGGCRKVALCVGLLEVDPAAYGGQPQTCAGCDLDARDFANVLRAAGMATSLLLNDAATRAGVMSAMNAAARQLSAGDLFVMVVAGHGARGKIADGTVHESWCLWDGMLLDSEIIATVKHFASGVRIVMINDQCHSGGIFTESSRSLFASSGLFRGLFGSDSTSPMLIQFAACRAEESSIGYAIGGTWMTALMKVLAVNKDISWQEWFTQARNHPSLTKDQSPQWVEMGPVSEAFRNGAVFQ